MLVKSRAKINLSLKITGTTENGYHTLDMIELPIELHDVLEITHRDADAVSHITSDELRLAKFKDNTCKKALDAMRGKYNFDDNFDIFIHKNIPFAAGLGGGSSNCASTINAINSMMKLKAKECDLLDIALSIGADVPFFFYNKPARVKGIGEIIEPIKVSKDFYCVLIKPEKGCSSKEIYGICSNFSLKQINTELVLEGLAKGDENLIAQNIGNDLMEPAMSVNEEIGPALQALRNFGFKVVSMSGSGSTCFALSRDKRKCNLAYKSLKRQGYNAYISKVIR